MRVLNRLNCLFYVLLFSCAQTSFSQYIPVSVLLSQQEEQFETDLTSSLDPIMSELALHIDQQYAPVLVSRQLVHALMRAQNASLRASEDPTTHLGRLSQLLKQYAHAHDASKRLSFQSYYNDKDTHVVSACDQEEKHPELFNQIEQCVNEQRSIMTYLFLTQLHLETWHIFSVLKNNGVHSLPLYVMLPCSTSMGTERNLQKDTRSFKYMPTELVKRIADTESIDLQQLDHARRISAISLSNALNALRSNIYNAQPHSSFIMTLGGHGRYTRSSYGIVADRLKPTSVHDLPTIDQTAREPKDTASSIAALSLHEFKQLLTLLNTTVPTSFLYYDSCYTGNNHLTIPYVKKNGSPRTLNFVTATANADSGVSKRDSMQLGFDRTNPTCFRIKCPMDPASFFQKTIAWLKHSQKISALRPALLCMLGVQDSVASMVRARGSKTFVPILAPQHIDVSAERLRSLTEIIVQEQDSHLFLRHNVIKSHICGYVPLIRSLIPTNSIHYIDRIECLDLMQRDVLSVLTHMFFHEHHTYAMNRMIFFVKQCKLTTQGHTHVLRDLFILHHRHTDSQKNNFVIWRNPKKRNPLQELFSFARQSPSGTLEADVHTEFKQVWAYETMFHYLSLGTQQQSYIEAPALSVALPEAFDDSAVRSHCATALMDRAFKRKHMAKVWKLIGL